ncbi:MAG: proton-conducting transporter membrane subunit [Syntrophobacteraceae bacterium]|nr:proton-conducting transporter membrane subunit [Syntrophobacteraceae bacterium]
MILLFFLLPIIAGVAALFVPSDRFRRLILLATAVAHCALTGLAWVHRPAPAFGCWLLLDDLGLLFLSIVSFLFLAASFYSVGYFQREDWGNRQDFEGGFLFSNAREATFTCCLLFFLATMSLVCLGQDFGLLWVAVEATTLSSAPLIYFHRHRRSLEATWKYLMICSVGIGLALLGNFCLAVAATLGPDKSVPLLLSSLISHGGLLHPLWLKVAFLLLVVGYGTKLGLAPMHTWLPDAHSEAPSMVSALLSGALLNCAFLAVLRILQVCQAAGLGEFGQHILLGFGLLSMTVAALFIVAQSDYKRMLAYSSIEHMGILSLAVGLGGAAYFGALFHAVNHSLTKGMLFLVAGNILTAYKTKSAPEVRGAAKLLPISGVLWVAGFLAITGSPPFGPFLSELIILKSALDQGRIVIAVVYLVLLSVIFIGMAAIVFRMCQGAPVERAAADLPGVGDFPAPAGESALTVIPPLVLGLAVLVLGLYLPPALKGLLEHAARAIGG